MDNIHSTKLRRALAERVRYYNELGIYDFYRRERNQPRSEGVSTEDIAEITDDSARHARQPPSMARGERIGRYPDIGNSPDSADQVEEGKPAQQGQTAQSLVAISKLIIQEEIRSHRHQRGNTLYDSELEP